jgi:hypothetical protein
MDIINLPQAFGQCQSIGSKIAASDQETRANPYLKINSSGFGYHPDIKMNFEKISRKHVGFSWRRCPPKNKDITRIFRLRKALISWRCHTFIRSRMACDISSSLYDIYSGKPALRSAAIYFSKVS